MIAVGIDVSKSKSTVAILNGDGSVRAKPFDVRHVTDELHALVDYVKRTSEPPTILMEPTSHYHYPLLKVFQEADEGYLTNDIESARESLKMLPGGKEVPIIELMFDESEMRFGAPLHVKACNFQYQDRILELIQPINSPDSFIAKELAKSGPGLHHLAYALHEDYDTIVADLMEKGWTIGMAACKKDNNNCFVTSPDGTVVLELIERIPD